MIVLNAGHFSNFVKFSGNMKILRKGQIPWLGSILQPAENWALVMANIVTDHRHSILH